ncbi:hypothetical protein [Novosphingobium terrae]|uniref:hypothetical protein n=1 Tax=Novosphingobium terrae TaxID=2726189 RepID=UPI00197EBF4B|nr:hypothetical protein [Novosphingobium terrae]
MRLPLFLAPILALFAAPLLAAAPAKDVVREERQVVIHGVKETWRLIWRGKPKEGACSPQDLDTAVACPCNSFAYAQEGIAFLERRRPHARPERLPLAPFFAQADFSPSDTGTALLQRWPFDVSDIGRMSENNTALRAQIRARPAPTIMRLADYNHDGIASEFLLPMGNSTCGHRYAIVVGITRDNPHLHAFTSKAHPRRPLLLQFHEWQALAASPHPAPIIDWQCNDHGNDRRSMLTIAADKGQIHGTMDQFACKAPPSASHTAKPGKTKTKPRRLSRKVI